MLRRRPAAAAATLLFTCVALSARQDRAADVLARARDAIGGEARLRAVHSLSLKATSRTTGNILYRTRDYAFVSDEQKREPIQIDLELPDRFVLAREISLSRRYTGVNGHRLIAGVLTAGRFRPDTFIGVGGPSPEPRVLQTREREFLRWLVAWLLVAPEDRRLQFTDAGEGQTPDGIADTLDAVGAYDFTTRLSFDKRTHRLSMLTFEEPPIIRRVPLPPPLIEVREDTPLRKVIETADGTGTFEFDQDKHQLVKMTYLPKAPVRPPAVRSAPPVSAANQDAPLFSTIQAPDPPPSMRTTATPIRAVGAKYIRVTQVCFGDYRPVDGILLPYHVTIDTGPVEEWQISSVKVNPKIDPKRFAPR